MALAAGPEVREGAWFAAAFHCTQVLKSRPDNPAAKNRLELARQFKYRKRPNHGGTTKDTVPSSCRRGFRLDSRQRREVPHAELPEVGDVDPPIPVEVECRIEVRRRQVGEKKPNSDIHRDARGCRRRHPGPRPKGQRGRSAGGRAEPPPSAGAAVDVAPAARCERARHPDRRRPAAGQCRLGPDRHRIGPLETGFVGQRNGYRRQRRRMRACSGTAEHNLLGTRRVQNNSGPSIRRTPDLGVRSIQSRSRSRRACNPVATNGSTCPEIPCQSVARVLRSTAATPVPGGGGPANRAWPRDGERQALNRSIIPGIVRNACSRRQFWLPEGRKQLPAQDTSAI